MKTITSLNDKQEILKNLKAAESSPPPPPPTNPVPLPPFAHWRWTLIFTLLKLQGDPTCKPGVNLIIGISESQGEFPVFDRLVHESLMHLFGHLASVVEICFKLESQSVTVFPLKRGLNTSRPNVMWFVSTFPGVFCSHIEQRAIWSGNYL